MQFVKLFSFRVRAMDLLRFACFLHCYTDKSIPHSFSKKKPVWFKDPTWYDASDDAWHSTWWCCQFSDEPSVAKGGSAFASSQACALFGMFFEKAVKLKSVGTQQKNNPLEKRFKFKRRRQKWRIDIGISMVQHMRYKPLFETKLLHHRQTIISLRELSLWEKRLRWRTISSSRASTQETSVQKDQSQDCRRNVFHRHP